MKKQSLSDKLNRLNSETSPKSEPVIRKKEETEEAIPIKGSPAKIIKSAPEPEKKREAVSQTEEEHDSMLIEKSLKEARERARMEKLLNSVHILLIFACMYTAFLIYGVAMTTYEYNASGTVEAQRTNVSEIKARKEFEKIYYYYEACRGLYECTLLLDYRLGAGEEDPLMIAPEYEALLDTVENLSIKTEALTVETGYTQVKNMMLSWIQSDIAVYLQNMSSAIAQNDAASANNALQDRDRVYNSFLLITQNLAAFGENIKGVDLQSIRHWTPENYIDEEINGETS